MTSHRILQLNALSTAACAIGMLATRGTVHLDDERHRDHQHTREGGELTPKEQQGHCGQRLDESRGEDGLVLYICAAPFAKAPSDVRSAIPLR